MQYVFFLIHSKVVETHSPGVFIEDFASFAHKTKYFHRQEKEMLNAKNLTILLLISKKWLDQHSK